ncbi:RNA polymerase sigma factor [Streptomyces sp. MNP-20]|uniref:RNA polymerase sigma factor n=1 Tax=Streptomyces sp. MNP-20 TaxID=2721165 RepID=UPI001557DC50|nr:sigma-70 family RNA polymerase sigma factor [Streptomyces sp. MNP-20]
MTEDAHADDPSPVAAAVLPLPLEFEALYLANQQSFHGYAVTCLGGDEAAEDAVHRAFLEILGHWEALLAESNLQQQVWSILRRVVISQRLQEFRHELAGLHSDIGLFAAMSSLPPRQFDVLVLRHVLEYDTQRISWYMGVTPSTVDYHCRKANERLEPAVSSYIKTKGESK